MKNSIKNSQGKLLIILGPTASGKSNLAIKLAKIFNGEIISADSRQVYQGMDIGTGKVPRDKTSKQRYFSKGIEHHLLDVIKPQKYFSVVQYQKIALKTIKKIWRKEKLPILCGGTGLYISSLIEGWQFPKVKPNIKLRKELEQKTTKQLFKELKKIDPERAKNIDCKNKRRLIRALEIVFQKGKVGALKKIPPPWDILIIGIRKEKKELKKLIKKRLEKRLKEKMVDEIKKLKKQGVSSQRLESFGLEYRWLNRYLENKLSFIEMKKNLLKDIFQYAKRQMTWFKKIADVKWIKSYQEAKIITNKWLKNS